uniref:Uncharacterized protein n=1 Tax=Mycena chlorophos TaxID=658473 RepID=A0ABQ0LHT2_MYCCL|nr:predicted protein [Mycena chlorophos]
MILLNAQGTALLQRSHSGSELPDYITSNRTQPPRYSRVRKPKNPLSYTFTMPDSENVGSTVLMVPPPESDDQARYRVAVSLNLNPFIPICYRTTVHRVLHGQESFIGDFELSLNHRRAIVSLGDVTTRLVNVLYSINSSPRHWTWRWDDIGLRWDCRNTLEDGSPMCICYTLASTTQLATFVPPPFDAPPPLPEAVCRVYVFVVRLASGSLIVVRSAASFPKYRPFNRRNGGSQKWDASGRDNSGLYNPHREADDPNTPLNFMQREPTYHSLRVAPFLFAGARSPAQDGRSLAPTYSNQYRARAHRRPSPTFLVLFPLCIFNMPSRAPSAAGVQLPRTLERPAASKVSRGALLAASPDLGLLSVEDIRKHLLQNATPMLAGTSSLSPNHLPVALPKTHLPPYFGVSLVPAHDGVMQPIYPTHVLAIANTSPATAADTHLLFPIHGPVLAAHCSKLPALPPPAPRSRTTPATLHLPVLPLALPSAPAFAILLPFLYARRPATALGSLLPIPPAFLQTLTSHKAVRATLGSPADCHALAAQVCTASGGSVQTLMTHTAHVKELWQDVVALGIDDDALWDTVHLAYEIVLGALNLAVLATR